MLAMINFEPSATFQLPAAFSAAALDVDDIYYAMYWFSLVFTVAITGATLWFIIKYKRKKGDKLEPPGNVTMLEITWTVIPILFIVVLFHVGFKGYVSQAVPYESALEIRVRGTRWRIVYTMGFQGTCTFIFFCSGPQAEVDNVRSGATVDTFGLSDGGRQTRTFTTGAGAYDLTVSPGDDTARWQVWVEDYY